MQERVSSIKRSDKRLYNLDYLRGLAALGIMIYHYSIWENGAFLADSFLGRVGVYGVAIFYVLSGLTLFHVYYPTMDLSRIGWVQFYKKRFWRIFPLLWLSTLLSILISGNKPDFFDVLLNITGLFGFFKWDTYFATGAWSIGNECVFYAIFPLFVYGCKQGKVGWMGMVGLVFGLFLYFAFFVLDTECMLNEQWKAYVNPLNQLGLFLGGFLIGFFFQNRVLSNRRLCTCLGLGILVFLFFPAEGDLVHLVTGFPRIALSLSCFLICLGGYKTTTRLPRSMHHMLALWGEASYSVYLLHPIVYWTIRGINTTYWQFPSWMVWAPSVIATLLLSSFSYAYFEKYFMKFGKENRAGAPH